MSPVWGARIHEMNDTINQTLLCRHFSTPARRKHMVSTHNTSPNTTTAGPIKYVFFDSRKRERIFSSLASAPVPSLDHDDELLAQAGVTRAEVQHLAQKRPTPLRLADMYKYGTSLDAEQRIRNAQFLHEELQIRCAQRAVDLLTLPHGMSEVTPIRQVASIYLGYLGRFKNIPVPQTSEQEDEFTDFLSSLILDRTTIPMSIARGVISWGEGRSSVDDERLQDMEDALYRFFTARTGLRFLATHHVVSSQGKSAKKAREVTFMFPHDDGENYRGCIQTNINIGREVERVTKSVRDQVWEYYGVSPEIDIINCIPPHEASAFTYVPHHLHYTLSELLKNSCRATVLRQLDQEAKGIKEKLHPIRVVLVKGDEDITIKIADRGGGIPRSRMTTIWRFAHSTADEKETESDFGTDSASGARIRGFGLPLARIYARYFGGELTLKSMEGYGLDAYLHLPRLGDSCENLPLRVRASPGELDSMPTK